MHTYFAEAKCDSSESKVGHACPTSTYDSAKSGQAAIEIYSTKLRTEWKQQGVVASNPLVARTVVSYSMQYNASAVRI